MAPSTGGGDLEQGLVLLAEAGAVRRSYARCGVLPEARGTSHFATPRESTSVNSLAIRRGLIAAVAAAGALAACTTLGANAANATPPCDITTWYGVTLTGTQYSQDGTAYKSQFTFDNSNGVSWTIDPDSGTNQFFLNNPLASTIRIVTSHYVVDLAALKCENGHVTQAAAISYSKGSNGGTLRTKTALTAP
jgi:hypothetical protein